MRILYLSQHFPPEMGAPSARVSELAAEWARSGHSVTVLTGFPNHPTGVVPPRYRGNLFVRESRDGYSVLRVWLYATPNKGFFKRIVGFFSFFLSSAFLGAFLAPRADILIATSPQLLAGFSGLFLARLRGTPFVFEVRDLWPKTAVDLGVLRDPRLISLLERIERFLYRSADLVVVVSEDFIEHIKGCGVPQERILFLPNGVNAAAGVDGGPPLPPAARRVPGVLTVAYVGTHGMCQGLSTAVRVADRFREDGSVRFLFVGEGAEKEMVKKEAEELGLGNCTFLDAVPHREVNAVYAESDVCLVPLLDRPVFKTVIPSKIFEIMATGRPVLLSVGGRAERLVQEAEAGLCVPPEDADAIAAAIRRLRDEPALRERLGENGRAFVWKHFDRGVLAGKYAAALKEAAK